VTGVAAGGGRKALKVEILGDASGAVKAAKDTEKAFDGISKSADGVNLHVGGIAKGLGGIGAAAGAAGAASAGAFAGLAAAAGGAAFAIGGIGLAVAAQNLAVAGSFGELGQHIKTSMQDATAEFVPAMLLISDKIRTTFDQILPAVKPLFDAMAPIMTAFAGSALDSIGQLVPLFTSLVTAGMPFLTMLGEHLPAIAAVLATALQPVVDALGSFGTVVIGDLLTALGQILPPLGNLLSMLVTMGGPVLSTLLSALGPLVETLGPVLTDVIGQLAPTFNEVLGQLLPPILSIVEALAPILPMMAELAGTTLIALATAIEPVITALEPFIVQLIDQLKPVMEELNPIIADLGEQLGPLLADNIATILPPLLELTAALLPIIPPIVDIIAQLLIFEQTSRGALFTVLGELWNWFAVVIPPAFQSFKDGLRFIKDDAIDPVVGALQTLFGWIGDVIEKMEGLASNSIVQALGGVAGGGLGLIGFDTGGVVPGPKGKPRIVLAHGGETVLPTHKMSASAAIEKWVTYEDGSTGLQRQDSGGNWYGVTRAMDRGAYDLKAGMDFAALGWPAEDVAAIANLIAGGGGTTSAMSSGGVTVIVNNAGSVITERDLVQTVRSGLLQAGRYGRASL
jgi:phage-related protein